MPLIPPVPLVPTPLKEKQNITKKEGHNDASRPLPLWVDILGNYV